ncbi:MAG: NAD-dependent succinate-semialdehyde dehydrogenase [Pirellulaceae bacterium]
MLIASINPANNELIKTYEAMTASQVQVAIDCADRAYHSWRKTAFDDRKKFLVAFAAQLRERSEEFARLISLDMGKRIAESRYEIEYCANIAEYYAMGAEKFLADEPLAVESVEAYLRHEPLGVLLGIMPWNFPFYQVVRFAAPNIMAGNVVLVKHAANVPTCAAAIEALFQEVGLPRGVYTNLFIPHELLEMIIADMRVQGVSLTGSERAGAAVAELAGKHLKRSVLELGGNDAFIVLEDADLETAVEMAVKGRMVNAGQSCVASKRFIVVEAVADRFLSGFTERVAKLKLGDPLDDETTLAPLSTEEAAVKLQEQVQATIDAGATVVLGGDRPDCTGAYFNPTILTNVTPDMPSFDQELFGPVATVYVVKNEQEAIDLANNSSYGLGGSVFTQDIERGRQVAEQIETGMMFINQPTKSQAELPFGGVKNSGYGRELSQLGILEFVNKKLIRLR